MENEQKKSAASPSQCTKNRNLAAFQNGIKEAREKKVPLLVFDARFLTKEQQHKVFEDFPNLSVLSGLLELCRSLEHSGACVCVQLLSEDDEADNEKRLDR